MRFLFARFFFYFASHITWLSPDPMESNKNVEDWFKIQIRIESHKVYDLGGFSFLLSVDCDRYLFYCCAHIDAISDMFICQLQTEMGFLSEKTTKFHAFAFQMEQIESKANGERDGPRYVEQMSRFRDRLCRKHGTVLSLPFSSDNCHEFDLKLAAEIEMVVIWLMRVALLLHFTDMMQLPFNSPFNHDDE